MLAFTEYSAFPFFWYFIRKMKPHWRGPPWSGGGAYGLRGSCRFRFLGIQLGGVY